MKAYKIDLSGFTGKVREVVSEAVQKKAFTLGWGWKREPTPISIHHTECPVLYLESDGVILKEDEISNWSHDPNTAITAGSKWLPVSRSMIASTASKSIGSL